MNYGDFIKNNKSGPVPRSKDDVKKNDVRQRDMKDFDAKRNAIRRRLGNKRSNKPGATTPASSFGTKFPRPDEKDGIAGPKRRY